MKILLDKIMNLQNLTIRQVSVLTGVSKSTINNIMNGRTSQTMDTMEQLATGLEVKISDLYASDYK